MVGDEVRGGAKLIYYTGRKRKGETNEWEGKEEVRQEEKIGNNERRHDR